MIRMLAFLMTVLLPSMVLAQVGPVAPASAAATNVAGTNPVDKNREKASTLYKDGQAAFDNGNYEKAAETFKAAYKLDPNPLLLYNVARAYESGDKTAEAIAKWKEYSELKDERATSKVHALKRVVELQALLAATKPPLPPSAPASRPISGTLIIKGISNESTARVDNIEVAPSDIQGGKPVLLDVGSHAITVLDAKNNVIGKGQVRIEGGKSTTWTYFPPEEPPLLTHKQWGWISVGVGALAATAAGYFTYSMYQDFAAADERNGNHAYTVGEFRSAVSDGENNRTRAIVSGVVAVVAGSLGGYLVITGDDESPTAAIAPSFGGLVLTGTF